VWALSERATTVSVRRDHPPHNLRASLLLRPFWAKYVQATADRTGGATRSDTDFRLPSVPATFSASRRRSRERVPPVRRASSGSFGSENKLYIAGPCEFATGCRRDGTEGTSMLLRVLGAEVWKRVKLLDIPAMKSSLICVG